MSQEPVHIPERNFEYIQKHLVGQQINHSPSAAGNWLQLTLEAFEEGYAMTSMVIRPEMTNPYRMLHGGMMCLMIDETIGWAIISLNKNSFYTSINLNTDFLYMAKEGERIYASARINRAGKKVINVSIEVKNSAGQLLAVASSNLGNTSRQIEPQHTNSHQS